MAILTHSLVCVWWSHLDVNTKYKCGVFVMDNMNIKNIHRYTTIALRARHKEWSQHLKTCLQPKQWRTCVQFIFCSERAHMHARAQLYTIVISTHHWRKRLSWPTVSTASAIVLEMCWLECVLKLDKSKSRLNEWQIWSRDRGGSRILWRGKEHTQSAR